MSSKREEERNEKIIRGLMKLPPNRRCINCNSAGPQYVCTTFWTFVCAPCSGIHREFTHRVKSVSMAKFTSQEVDSLQKGGNQRARELYLNGWDPQRNRLPDNSNVDKVREFVRNVYVNKNYALEKSSDRPSTDPQGLRKYEDEMRRASSYHSYSQSPPDDFQYEERRYGRNAPSLARKPGSERGLYRGKLSTFTSPSRFSDHGNDDRFASEGLSPSSQRGGDSPFSETSRDMTSEVPQHQTVPHNSDAISRSNGGRMLHPHRTESSRSFGSFDGNSQSFRSVNSLVLSASEPEVSPQVPHVESSSSRSLEQSPVSRTFGDLDLFTAPFAPQNVTSRPPTGSSNPQLPQLSSTKSVDLFQQYPNSSVPTFSAQQPSQITQASSLNLFCTQSQQHSATSSKGNISEVVLPSSGGWTTFDTAQNPVFVDIEKSVPPSVQSSNETSVGSFNPFSFDNGSSYSLGHEPSAAAHTFHQEGLQNVGITTVISPYWNAFPDPSAQDPIQNVLKCNEAEHCASDADKYHGMAVYEGLNHNGNVRASDQIKPASSSTPSHLSMAWHDFSMVHPMAGGHSGAPGHQPRNPFDQPYDSDMESDNMSQFLDVGSMQTALPHSQMPDSYVEDLRQTWFPQDTISPSFIPGEISFNHPHPSGSLELAVQAQNAQISNIPSQGPVASVGGNPFA